MIITEHTTISGRAFIYTYSDSGYMIERDGIMYAEAYDPAELASQRVYTETDTPIPSPEPEPEPEPGTDDATTADYENALQELGVLSNDEE